MANTQGIKSRWGWGFLLLLLLFHKPILKIYFILDYQEQILNFSRNYGVSSATISAIVFTESRFNAAARSHKGALGLMQIMPKTGEWVARQLAWESYHTSELFEPVKNLEVGIWYMAYLKRHFRYNEYLALASYNAGSKHVSQWLKNGTWNGDKIKVEQIPFPETKKYVIRILVVRKIYHYLYPHLT